MVATARIDSTPRTTSSEGGGGPCVVERGNTLSQIGSAAMWPGPAGPKSTTPRPPCSPCREALDARRVSR